MSLVLTELFGRHAREAPSRVALVDGENSLTYAELDRASDAVAAGLQLQGVEPGDRVAVVLPRSTALVVAVLGVLKCGAAYSPLDHAWPPARRAAIVSRLSASVVVDEALFEVLLRTQATLRAPAVAGDDLAVVLFTSGSTGEPKGVLCPHRAIARLVPRAGHFDLTTPPTMPLAAAVPWDVFSLELWGTLCAGGTLVVVRDTFLTPPRLRDLVGEHGVDSVVLATSVFALIVEEDVGAFSGMHQVLTGGEQLSTEHATTFCLAHPDVALINGYGPAENGIMSSSHLVTPADGARARIPIGLPAPGTTLRLHEGEILVSGSGLALGYLSDPDETARRFVDVPSDEGVVRAYRTGDRGHLGDDGLYYYAGRVDRQLKVRGHRVEPAEIEGVAERIDGISRASVVAIPGRDGAASALALFYTGLPDAHTVHAELRTELPAYLWPDVLEQVERFPLTSNGKIDLRALSERAIVRWSANSRTSASGSVERADEIEDLIASVMAEVLGRSGVPRDEDFFALGGNSLAAGRLAGRLGRTLGLAVPLDTVFRRPTVSGLAEWARAATADTASPAEGRDAAKSADHRPDGRIVLTPAQLPFLVAHQMNPSDLTALCPIVWDVSGDIDVSALAAALRDVTERHEALRSRYLMLDAPIAEVADARAPELRLVAQHGDVLPALLNPLDIEAGEVWRAALGPGRLGIVVHHVACDGQAVQVLADDLSSAYSARLAGRPPAFGATAPTLAEITRAFPVPPAEDLADQRTYWRSALSGVPTLQLPAGLTDVGRLVATHRELDAEALGSALRQARATETIALLAAYADTVSTLTGVADLVVGVPVARRQGGPEGRGVACTMTVACVRLAGRGLGDARAALVDSLRRPDVPVHDIARLARRRPLFEAVVSVQDNPEPQLHLPGVTARHVWVDTVELDTSLLVEFLPGGCLRVGWRADRVSDAFGEALADGITASLRALVDRDARTRIGVGS